MRKNCLNHPVCTQHSMPKMQFHFLAGAHVPPQPLNAPGTLDARQCQYHSWKPSVIICIKHNRRAFVQCVICMCPEVLAHVVASRKQEKCTRTFNTRSNQTLHYYKLCTWYKNIACWKLERYHLTIFCVILLVGGLGKKCRTFGSCTIAHCLVLTSFDKQLNNKYLVFLHSLQF